MHHSALARGEKAAIEARLAQLGFRMEHSLDALEENEGHAVIEVATGDLVDPPSGEVLDLAVAWSLLEGACATE